MRLGFRDFGVLGIVEIRVQGLDKSGFRAWWSRLLKHLDQTPGRRRRPMFQVYGRRLRVKVEGSGHKTSIPPQKRKNIQNFGVSCVVDTVQGSKGLRTVSTNTGVYEMRWERLL